MNPHNTKDEFCSQDCAAKERMRYWDRAPKMYALYAENQTNILGIFTSKDALERGASFVTAVYRATNQTLGKLFYEAWVVNYPIELKERDYINIK